MSQEAKWSFAGRGAGQIQGFNVAGLQWFADDPIGKVVREICQNSIDAAISEDKPVRVAMALREINSSSIFQLGGLSPFVSAASDAATKQDQSEAKTYWANAKKSLNQKTVRVLEFHDFETKGLTGPIEFSIENAGTPWIGLVMASGVNVASNDASGGSFGIGKSAPFVLSELRTVFYYTQEIEKSQKRFIGSAILQSIDVAELYPDEPARQGFGNFGMCSGDSFERPLLDEEVPVWALQGREAFGVGTGTSVFVPGVANSLTATEFANKATIATAANLYASVKFGILEVELDDGERRLINKENVDDVLDEVLSGKYGAPSDFAIEQLATAITIRDGVKHELQVPRFGDVEVYLRTGGETTGQNVGIARTNGQLITRRPPKLLAFGHLGLQPFDLFIYAKAEGVAKIIRAFEPPSHDSLFLDKAPQYRPRYDLLVDKVRDFLRENVGIKSVGKRRVGELNDIFGLSNFGDKDSDQVNESVKAIRVSEGSKSKSKTIWGKKPTKISPTPPVPTRSNTGSSTRQRIDPVANFGEEIAVTAIAEDASLQFRITNIEFKATSKAPSAKVWFNFPKTGPSQNFELFVVGDSQNIKLPIRTPGSKTWMWSIEVVPNESTRRSLLLEVGGMSFIGATVAGLLTPNGSADTTVRFDDKEGDE
jgi:hypothetical protein